MRSSCLIVVIGVWSCVYGGFLFLVSLHRLQMELRIDHYSADGPTDPTAVVFSSTCSCSSHGTVVLNPFKERLLRRRVAALVVCAHLGHEQLVPAFEHAGRRPRAGRSCS